MLGTTAEYGATRELLNELRKRIQVQTGQWGHIRRGGRGSIHSTVKRLNFSCRSTRIISARPPIMADRDFIK